LGGFSRETVDNHPAPFWPQRGGLKAFEIATAFELLPDHTSSMSLKAA